MKKEMLINVAQPEECRIAIVEDGVLEELYVERTGHESYVGNIYKGRIVNIEPSIQAAFVDFGVGRNGFLHVSDVEPAYYRHLTGGRDEREEGGRGRRGDRDRERGDRRSQSRHGRGRPAPSRPAAHEEDPERQDVAFAADFQGEGPPEMLPPDFGEAMEISVVNEWRDDEGDWSPPAAEAESVTPEEPEGPQEILTDETPSQLRLPAPKMPAAEPEEEAPSKPRRGRGGRGRSRRGSRSGSRKEKSPERTSTERGATPADTGASESTKDRDISKEVGDKRPLRGLEDPIAEEPSEKERDERRPPDGPELMGSAEHRTWPAGPDDEPPPSLKGSGSIQEFSDEDLSFSLRRPPEPSHDEPETYHHEPQPSWTEATEEAEPQTHEPEPVPEPEPEKGLVENEAPAPAEEEYLDLGEEKAVPVVRGRSVMDDLDEEEEYMPRRSSRGDRDRGRGRRNGGSRRGGAGYGRPGTGRPKPLIQDIFKKGQEVLVQVIKEGIGTKGPTLSTYISIAGRYLVLMPGLQRIGVSRKIQDDEQRRRLRDILNELKPPRGLGFIIRTAGLDRTKKELQRDLAYLSRLWQVVVRRIKKLKSPTEIYQESDMITRTIRDTFTAEISTVWIDEPKAFEHAQEFMQIVMPRYANRIKLYAGSEPIFHKYGIEEEISKIHKKHVPLPNGGSIVIEQTEALVAIDVNSGNFRADNNAEETAYQMNLLAAREIARQLRLRDLGGVIINDFIDMREEKHRRGVEKAMRDAVRRDRARTKVLKISQFGIIEMTRQRIRPSLKRSVFQDCTHCNGSGQVKTCESMSIEVMRMIQLATTKESITQIQVRVHESVADYILNRKRKELVHLEDGGHTQIQIAGVLCVSPEFLEFLCYDNNGNEILFPPPQPVIGGSRRRGGG
jgi:ribonuclease E